MRIALFTAGLWLCLSLIGGVARAQESTATVTPTLTATPKPFITGGQAIVVFPQAVRFSVTTTLAANEIRSATLTVFVDGTTSSAVDVDVAEAERRAKTPGALDVLWTITLNPTPKLFDAIYYTWDVTATDGRHDSATLNFTFVDPRVAWTASVNDAATLDLTVPQTAGDPSALFRGLQPVYNLLFGSQSPAPTFKWIIYPPTVAPSCSLDRSGAPVALDPVTGESIPCDPAQAPAMFKTGGYTPLQADTGTSAGMLAAGTDAMVGMRYGERWRAADVPDWFRFGFSTFFTGSRKTGLLTPAVAAARGERLYSLDTLASARQHDDLWRAESYALVLYLAGRTGIDGLLTLADQFGPDAPFQPTLEQALGQSLTVFVPTVQSWLLSDAAVVAFNYAPYGPATATPSATPLPSATATETATATATASPTRTPLPTASPTVTPIPVTPSVTPRPANSLATWTPVPTPVPLPPPAPDTTSPAETILTTLAALLVVGLIALYIRLGRRR